MTWLTWRQFRGQAVAAVVEDDCVLTVFEVVAADALQ